MSTNTARREFEKVLCIDCVGNFQDWPQLETVVKVNSLWSFVETQLAQTRQQTLREIYKLNDKLYDPIELGIRLKDMLKRSGLVRESKGIELGLDTV